MKTIRITANDHQIGWTAIATKSGHEPNGMKLSSNTAHGQFW
jgi:hypothetical protein